MADGRDSTLPTLAIEFRRLRWRHHTLRCIISRCQSAVRRGSRLLLELRTTWKAAIEHYINRGTLRRLALLGNHLPRRCGIATFTGDLCQAVNAERSLLDCFVVAMNDVGRRYDYPGTVRFEIAESDLPSYRRAADFLNVNDVDVVSVQHEYGIFGGKAGAHVLTLLRELRMPIVSTVHTILQKPNLPQHETMTQLCGLSERIVVMSELGRELLQSIHGVERRKIDLIPHGIPGPALAAGSKDTWVSSPTRSS